MIVPPVDPAAAEVLPVWPNLPGAPPHQQIPPNHHEIRYQNFPQDALWNLSHVLCDRRVRHEPTTYGYYNTGLSVAFPQHRRFQVDPQHPLRPIRPRSRNTSTGSGGEEHADNVTGRGQELGMQYPDFVISKPIPEPDRSKPRRKLYVAVVEIKLSHDALDDIHSRSPRVVDDLTQLAAYSRRLCTTSGALMIPGQAFPAYLVYGNMYTRLRVPLGNAAFATTAEPWQYVFQNFNPIAEIVPFFYRMCELASLYWNT